MKRLISIVLLMSLMLCACGKKPAETTLSTTEETVTASTAGEVTEKPTEVSALYRHPLTGEPQDKPFLERPVSVSLNNIVDAMPQLGIGGADILYEIETEGGITRCLGIFSDYKDLPKIGAVRSARTYFVNVSLAYDAVFAHCGGSDYAMIPSYDSTGTVLKNWEHLDAMYLSGFSRDQDRLNSGYAYEHTLVTNGEKLQKMLDDKGYKMHLDQTADYGLQFSEEVPIQGEPAENVEIRFQGGKKTYMTFNPETGFYEAHQYDRDWIDGNTKENLSFKNLIMLQTKQFKPDEYHSMYDLQGSGKGYLAIGGKIMPIKWQRDDVHKPFRYTFEDGTPVVLGVGKTYVAVDSLNGSVSYT